MGVAQQLDLEAKRVAGEAQEESLLVGALSSDR